MATEKKNFNRTNFEFLQCGNRSKNAIAEVTHLPLNYAAKVLQEIAKGVNVTFEGEKCNVKGAKFAKELEKAGFDHVCMGMFDFMPDCGKTILVMHDADGVSMSFIKCKFNEKGSPCYRLQDLVKNFEQKFFGNSAKNTLCKGLEDVDLSTCKEVCANYLEMPAPAKIEKGANKKGGNRKLVGANKKGANKKSA